jgi:hypothetical protein
MTDELDPPMADAPLDAGVADPTPDAVEPAVAEDVLAPDVVAEPVVEAVADAMVHPNDLVVYSSVPELATDEDGKRYATGRTIYLNASGHAIPPTMQDSIDRFPTNV